MRTLYTLSPSYVNTQGYLALIEGGISYYQLESDNILALTYMEAIKPHHISASVVMPDLEPEVMDNMMDFLISVTESQEELMPIAQRLLRCTTEVEVRYCLEYLREQNALSDYIRSFIHGILAQS